MKSFPVRIYFLALLLRIIPVLITRNIGIGFDDMYQYDMLARSLVKGNGYRWYTQEDLRPLEPYVNFDLSSAKGYDPERGVYTSFRAPLYPAFLAAIYFFSGTGPGRFFVARLMQAIFLGAPLAPLSYFVSCHLFPGSGKASRIAAYIIACYPMLLVYPLGLGTENLFFFLLLMSFLLLLKSISQPSVTCFLFSSFFLALTALTRSVILPFVFLAFCLLFFVSRRNSLIFLFAFIALVTPWVIRNSLLHHKLTGIETSMGYNLYLGYYPDGDGSFIFGPSMDLLTIVDDAERDRVGMQKTIGFIQAQPERVLPLAINRLGFFFGLEKRVLVYYYSNNIIGYIPFPILLIISTALTLPFIFISLSAALGISTLYWNPRSALLAILFITYTLPYILILSEDRFHLALVPFLAMLAAQFWTHGFSVLGTRWRESAAGKALVVCSIIFVLALLVNWGLELQRDADKIIPLFGPNGNNLHYPY